MFPVNVSHKLFDNIQPEGGRSGQKNTEEELPSGYVKIAKLTIEILSLPIKHDGSFHSYVNV